MIIVENPENINTEINLKDAIILNEETTGDKVRKGIKITKKILNFQGEKHELK